VRKYFMTEAVKPGLNKFTALHAALWDTGAFVYVPANARVTLPLAGDSEPGQQRASAAISPHAGRHRTGRRGDGGR
jgi:Fe-S cluster assembly scaffold protein SufB